MEFTKLLEERRSIRAFDPEKHVTAEQIQRSYRQRFRHHPGKTHRQHGTMLL